MCSLPAGQLACCLWVCWPLTNRSNRVGKIHTYRSFSVSHYAASFPHSLPHISTETHGNCETVRQTDVVRQRVCVMSAASKGTLWAQSGDGFPRSWHGWWPRGRTSGGKSIGWSRRTAITAHQCRAVMSHWVLTGFPLGQDQYPSSTPPFSLNRSEDIFCTCCFLFCLSGVQLLFLTCFKLLFLFPCSDFPFVLLILGLLLDVIWSRKRPSTVHVTAIFWEHNRKLQTYEDEIKSMEIFLSSAHTFRITIKSICLWWIDKGCRTPNAHCAVIWGRSH